MNEKKRKENTVILWYFCIKTTDKLYGIWIPNTFPASYTVGLMKTKINGQMEWNGTNKKITRKLDTHIVTKHAILIELF